MDTPALPDEINFNSPFEQKKMELRYGENPHQQGIFYGDYTKIAEQLHGKELSYNNLVDVDAAIYLFKDLDFFYKNEQLSFFAIIKHTNVCGIAGRNNIKDAWEAALAGDPESAFGGVLICNTLIDSVTAIAMNDLFFEVLIAPGYEKDAFKILSSKKNRVILLQKPDAYLHLPAFQYRTLLNGTLLQKTDEGNYIEWTEASSRAASLEEKKDLEFANLVCKHLKSNAIALVKNRQLIGKGCGQTSRIDALRQAIEKARQFNFDMTNAVLASDAFFPFDDCVKIAHQVGITAFIQPGGSIRDKDSILYCQQQNLTMVMTGIRHFKH